MAGASVVGQDSAYTVNVKFRENVENLESTISIRFIGRILGTVKLFTTQRNILWKRVFLF